MNVEFSGNLNHLDISRSIIQEFIKENPEQDINAQTLTDSLAKKLLQLSPKPNGGHQKILVPNEDFPKDMRVWALGHTILNIENINPKTLPKEVQEIEVGREHGVDQQVEVEQSVRIEQVQSKSAYTYANRDWSDVEVVVKAKSGQRGAWFFANSQRGSVVVKGQDDAEMQLMGTIFLRQLGINAPDLRIIERSSEEGQQISKLGEKEGLNSLKPSQYIVMDRVMGSSYDTLPSEKENIKIVVDNLENLGELAIYDLIIGNFDRFQLDGDSINAGNLMFQNGILFAIDTDCIYQEDRQGFTKLALKKIIEGRANYHEKIAKHLAKNLGSGIDLKLLPSEKILAGMEKAVNKLMAFADDVENRQKMFVQSCAERGGLAKAFPEHVTNFLSYIKSSQLKKMK